MVTLGRKIDFARIGDMLVNRHDICAAFVKPAQGDYATIDLQLCLYPMKAAFTVANLPASLGYPALDAINQFLAGRLEGEEITTMFDQRRFGERE